MQTEFRKAAPADLPAMLNIIAGAQAFMKTLGIDQWQGGYPPPHLVRQDIEEGRACVLCARGEPAVIASVFMRAGECEAALDAYDTVYGGAWRTRGPYAAVHRVAAAEGARGTGLARRMMDELEAVCRESAVPAIRIDTHPGNTPMRRRLEKCGFARVGTIYIAGGPEAGGERVAYDKLL